MGSRLNPAKQAAAKRSYDWYDVLMDAPSIGSRLFVESRLSWISANQSLELSYLGSPQAESAISFWESFNSNESIF
jgi:hypothetical protein